MKMLLRYLPENLRHPPPRMLRQFSALLLLLLCGLGVANHVSGRSVEVTMALAVTGIVVGGAGLVLPALVRPIFVAWTAVTFPIGWVISRLTLALIYFCIFTPIAVVFRLRGRDRLHRHYEPSAETYWRAKPSAESIKDYFRQF